MTKLISGTTPKDKIYRGDQGMSIRECEYINTRSKESLVVGAK